MLIWSIWLLDSKIELSNGINLFFCMLVLGVDMVQNGRGQSCDGALKLAASEKWINGINGFFAC